MNDDLVIISESPGGDIEANFAALESRIAEIVADYTDIVVTPKTVKQAKKDRAYLNSLSTSLNQRRKDVKQRYMAPVVAFENRVKELDAPIKEASAAIDAQVKVFEEEQKVEKRIELVQHYEGCAGALAEVVPFSRIEDPKWLNISVSIVKAQEEIDAIIERIATGIETIDGLELAHPIEAKAEFFETLDISRAIARSKQLQDQIDAAKRLIEQTKPEPAPEPAPAPAQTPEPAPAPLAEPTNRYTLTVTCTESECQQLIAALKSLGLTGTVRRDSSE